MGKSPFKHWNIENIRCHVLVGVHSVCQSVYVCARACVFNYCLW